MDFFLCVLGLVMVVEGTPYFAFPERMKVWMKQILTLPDASLRRMGLALMMAGLFFVYLGRS